MQFYRDGYRPGDPDLEPAAPQALARSAEIGDTVDVLIVGTGPAGTVLAAQLAAFPEIDTRIIERRQGPLRVGQADGVACRTVEMFQAFGLADALLREAYWVNEVRFWGPSATDRARIVRRWWAPLLIAAAVVLVLTAVFDNLMIGAGLMTYTEPNISGARLGLVPLEDFTYPLAALLLLPALWLLTRRRGSRS